MELRCSEHPSVKESGRRIRLSQSQPTNPTQCWVKFMREIKQVAPPSTLKYVEGWSVVISGQKQVLVFKPLRKR